jgi:hypothetical protein
MGKDVNRFQFDLPAGWEDQTVYFFRGPVIDGQEQRLMLTIDRHLQQDTIADFALQRTRPITSSLQGIEVLKDEDTTVAGCYPSWEFVYRWIPSDEAKTYKKHVFVLRGGYGFSFEMEFSKKAHKLIGDQVKKVIENLLPGTYEPEEG